MKEKNSRENLTDTAKDFFHMIFQFAKLKVKKKTQKLLFQKINFKNLQQTHVEYFNITSIKTYLTHQAIVKLSTMNFYQKNNTNIIKQNFFKKKKKNED